MTRMPSSHVKTARRTKPPSLRPAQGKKNLSVSVNPRDARQSALAILDLLNRENRTLDAIVAAAFQQMPEMAARDRSLTQTIVYGVLRWQRRLDAYIGHFSKTSLSRIDPVVLNLLRIAMFQILYLDRVPASAAVNTAVQLAKAHAPAWVVGFVNGLLRTAVREHAALTIPIRRSDPVQALSVEKSFPPWLIQRWLQRFGQAETVALCDAVNTIPEISIRVNTLKIDREQAMDAMRSEAREISPTRHSPLGICLSNLNRAIDQMTPFQQGLFQVQDEAAQLVTLLLDPQPGETILDACAGLGGKAGHIAQAMRNQGSVIAADYLPAKLRLLQQEMNRLGITCVHPRVIDWSRPDLVQSDGPRLPQFDRVLLDAPCSGIGVMRRNPDIKWRAEKSNLNRYALQQLDFLGRMASLVKPGGRLIYAVCSFEPEENERVVNGFLKNHSEFDKESINCLDPDAIAGIGCRDGFLRTFPHCHAMDGFFAACLKKAG